MLAATKCNSLVEWDVINQTSVNIPIPPRRPPSAGACGIHAVAVNATQDLIACGGSHPADAVVLDHATYQPLLSLEGHDDWIFDMCFIRNDVLATAGRDCAVALWNIRDLPTNAIDSPVSRAPALIRRAHNVKVRALRYLEQSQVRWRRAAGWKNKSSDVILHRN